MLLLNFIKFELFFLTFLVFKIRRKIHKIIAILLISFILLLKSLREMGSFKVPHQTNKCGCFWKTDRTGHCPQKTASGWLCALKG